MYCNKIKIDCRRQNNRVGYHGLMARRCFPVAKIEGSRYSKHFALIYTLEICFNCYSVPLVSQTQFLPAVIHCLLIVFRCTVCASKPSETLNDWHATRPILYRDTGSQLVNLTTVIFGYFSSHTRISWP